MMLHALLETVIREGHVPSSRIGPMRTAVKQYAAMLGLPPEQCPPASYHLPESQLRALIETNAPKRLGPHALRNLKNNLRFLLRRAVERQLIDTPQPLVRHWRETYRLNGRPRLGRPEYVDPSQHYGLWLLPERLAHEFAEYSAWSTALYAKNRPARVKKRPTSMAAHRNTIVAVAGFAVHVQHATPEELSLRDLVEPSLVSTFVDWWTARRGLITITIHSHLSHLQVLAHHWLRDEPTAKALREIRAGLAKPTAVMDKASRWLSLRAIDEVGRALYPLTADRIRASVFRRQAARHLKDPTINHHTAKFGFRGTAAKVGLSLLLRLWVRIPLRIRNMREMALDRNLVRRPDGTWQITFRGAELKIGHRGGRENVVVYQFPQDLQPLLEEWLHEWRPRLAQASERSVFVGRLGTRYPEGHLRDLINRATYRFTGIAVTPHLIRDIWATEYIKATRDIAGAAYMLGDTVEVVLKHYAHLLDAEAEQRATSWLQSQLNGH